MAIKETKPWMRITPLVLVFFAFALSVSGAVSYDWVVNIRNHSSKNPVQDLSGVDEYLLERFGNWLACFEETANKESTCSLINFSCGATPCWIRNDGKQVCGDAEIALIPNCEAFNATRILLAIGVLLYICALILQFTWLCEDKVAMAFWGGGAGLCATILCMCAYVIIQVTLVSQPRVSNVFDMGCGYFAMLAGWICGLAGALATLAVATYYRMPVNNWSYDEAKRVRTRFADEEARFEEISEDIGEIDDYEN